MEPVCSVLMNEKADWEAQKEALLTIRSLIAGGNASHPSFAAKIVPTAHRLSKLVRYNLTCVVCSDVYLYMIL